MEEITLYDCELGSNEVTIGTRMRTMVTMESTKACGGEQRTDARHGHGVTQGKTDIPR